MDPSLILLTGASGYVGGELLKRLQAANRKVRCLVRKPESMRNAVRPETEIFGGDVLEKSSLTPAMNGVKTAFYLIHSMGGTDAFEEHDRLAAQNFGKAAKDAGVSRIIYLGGLGENRADLSPHLRSRHEVGEILRQSGVQTVEFRASVILGAGSLSFEMLRALVERLPVMITPRWVAIPTQPIAIDDILEYLLAGADVPLDGNPIFEIGGTDRLSYGELMDEYARLRGLRRLRIPVPVLTPHLSSLWLGLVTPYYARVGRELIESIRHSTVVNDDSALRVFAIRPKSTREALAGAIEKENSDFLAKDWDQLERRELGLKLFDSRKMRVASSVHKTFEPVRKIGGSAGWYHANWLWRLRGALDRLFGGPGMRGRQDSERVGVGDFVDCWRVEVFEPDRRLRLKAQMKLPGEAWLEFAVGENSDGSCSLRQTAVFNPRGLLGRAYWYFVYPLHQYVFQGMLRRIATKAEKEFKSAGILTK